MNQGRYPNIVPTQHELQHNRASHASQSSSQNYNHMNANNNIYSPIASETMNPPSARAQSQFYATLKRYTERIRQQRDISLGYLGKINELSEQLRLRDQQNERLLRINKELTEKLNVYNSVLSRSRAKKSMMNMSMLLTQKMTESIIETDQEYSTYESMKPFEQFFVVDASQSNLSDNERLKFAEEQLPLKFTYLFYPQNPMTDLISSFLKDNTGSLWELQPFGGSTSEKRGQYCLFLCNSAYTTQREKNPKLRILDEMSPSYYYYLPCIVQKEIVSRNGRYFWAPIVYGFVTMFPFPDYFFHLLQQIVEEVKIKSEQDRKRLSEGLIELDKCALQFGKEELHCNFRFLTNKNQTWWIPSPSQVDNYALSFSVGVLQKFALELIIDVLILLLLQIPITVVSEDQILLSKFMFYFVYIIKPLKYPFPIVFNMKPKLATLLQSPFPTFTGTTDPKIVEPFLNERAVFDLDNKVAKSWPMLGHLDSSRQFLMKIAQKAGGYSKLGIVTQEIIKGHQYRELEPYWKDFSSTQIYKNYVYQN